MTLEELLVRIKVENKQAVKGLEEAKKAADQATGRFDGLRKKLTELGRALGKKPKAEVAKDLEKGLKAADGAIAQTERKIQSLQRAASKTTKSEEFKTVEQDLKAAESALTRAAVARDKAREKWEKAGGTNASTWTEKNIKAKAQFEEANAEYIETRREVIRLQDELARLKEEGSHVSQTDSARAAEAQLQAERANLERLKRFRESLNANLEGAVSNPALQRLQTFLNGARKAGAGVKNFGSKSVKALKGVVSWIEKMGRGFGTVLSKIPLLNRIPKTLNKIKRGLFMGSGMRSLIKLGAAGFLVYRAVAMMREGFKNLAQYSSQTNSDLSMLMSSLATLKNALATAFAPILTAIAPALNTLIQLLVKAATAVAHFTAAFTGKSTVVVAKQQNLDYAASLGDAADAAGSANDAAKEYQKTLLGFDQMNVLNDTDKSSGSGGSGGGGGGANFGDMFETVEVGSGAASLADRIKAAWKAADFTDLGRDLGNKIADELNKIPWEKLQSVAYKVGKSIATGFNGLNDSAFWGSLGTALGKSINTVVSGISGFVENFDWKKAGKAFATGINKFFDTVDWKKIGKTISTGVKGMLDTLVSLFSTIDWEQAGKNLVSTITSVDWAGIIVKAIKAAGSLTSGILNFIKGAFEEAFSAVAEWIESGKAWEGIKSIGKTMIDVGVNLVGDAWEAIKTAVSGIWNVVKAIAEKLGIGKTSDPTEANPAYYPSREYQGVDMSQTVTVDGKATDGFKKLYSEFNSIKDSKAVKTGGGERTEGFKTLHSQFSAIKSNKAVKTAGGTRTEGFNKLRDQFAAIKNNTAVKTANGKRSDSFTSTKNAYDSVINKSATVTVKGLIGNKLKQAVISFQADGGLYRNGQWMPVTAAAGGGSFTTGQMFVAREAGPELVGRIGSGTSVMNNDQIVASVSAGVAKGAYQAFVSAFSDTGGLHTNVVLQGDAAKFFRAMQQQAIMYMNSTGQSPFPM